MPVKIVLAHGVFDVLHYGHLKHLEKARTLGDRLVVSVTADRYVGKGPDRPIFPHEKRAEMLSALRIVDLVLISCEPTPTGIIMAVQPDIYVKGGEYRGRLPEQELIESLGGRVVFTDEETHSSTAIIERMAACS